MAQPELAVTDTYRAAVYIHVLSGSSGWRRKMKTAVLFDYVRLEKVEMRVKEPWTFKSATGWANNNLTRIALSPALVTSRLPSEIVDSLETGALSCL